MKQKDSINIAVISAGSDDARIISTLSECSTLNLIGVCATTGESLEALKQANADVPLFERVDELQSIGNVDLVIDTSDADIPGLDALESVEIVRGKSADIIRWLAQTHQDFVGDVDTILSAGIELASQKDSASMYRAIVENAMRITGCSTGSLLIFDERTEECRLAESVGYGDKFERGYTWELEPGGITETLLDKDDPLFIQDVNTEDLFDNPVMNEGTVSVLAVALREADEVIGLLFVGDFSKRIFNTNELSMFLAYSNQASLALQKALLLEQNESLTVVDSLTGLFNSGHFFEALEAEINRTNRYGGYFAVLVMDLDNLGDINNMFGHAKGDWVIKRSAQIVVECSRTTDYKARYGGDEFAMILPNTNCQQALVVANRIRRQVHDLSIENEHDQARLSISIGIAEFPNLGSDSDSLITAVNTALMVCKQRGRNLVCCYEQAQD